MKKQTSELSIEYQLVRKLRSNPGNARTHSKHQINQIAKSMSAFGFTSPILVDSANTVIAGHGRLEAAKHLKISRVPTIRLEDLTPEQALAYMLADNRLAEIASWDRSILAIDLQDLLSAQGDFDVTLTGFEIPEIDLLLSRPAARTDADDTFEAPDAAQAVSQVGDVWKLGKHRVLCGSALEHKSYSALLGTRRAALVFTDPPFNVPIAGHVSGNGAVCHREFEMASGEMSEFEFVSFLRTALALLSRFSKPDSVHFICRDWRHMEELIAAGKHVYSSLLNLCVWVKNNCFGAAPCHF